MTSPRNRILVIKHGALGDIIQGLDAYASLRASFKDAMIAVLTSAPFAGLMRSMPYFDEVYVDERAPFWRIDKTLAIGRILRNDFDIIIDLQCSSRTAAYHRYLVQSGQDWIGNAPNCSHPYPDFTGIHNTERMLTAVKMAGGAPIQADLSFFKTEDGLDVPSPYGLIMPGCSPAKPSKRWPFYAELAALLAKDGITPVIIGTLVDKQACDAVAEQVPEAVNLCQKTSLSQLANLAASAAISVGNDSGTIFLCAKTNAPAVMIMGPDTDEHMSAPTGRQADFIKTEDMHNLSAEAVYKHLCQRRLKR